MAQASWVSPDRAVPARHLLQALGTYVLPAPCNPQQPSQPRAKFPVPNVSKVFSCSFTSFQKRVRLLRRISRKGHANYVISLISNDFGSTI
jgi:hypothetical protein